MDQSQLLEVVRALMEQPTAPFHEDAVRDEIAAQLQKCPHVTIEYDEFGNMIARYQRGTSAPATWAFGAHMDHPGWIKTAAGEWQFLGSVRENFLVNPKRREFGDFAMWDLPAFDFREGKIYSRACDDLLGCAEIIGAFRELESESAEAHCLGIFTRAEEVGFWGAIKLARSKLLPRTLTILSLETSTPRGGAEIGRGPIVRVGDRLSIFDSDATAHLLEIAREEKIPVQRCLLDGGACEASAYQLYGYRSIAASIGLGNYHNCTLNETIDSEYVSFDDYENMVRLCVALVTSKKEITQTIDAFRAKLETRAADADAFFRKLN